MTKNKALVLLHLPLVVLVILAGTRPASAFFVPPPRSSTPTSHRPVLVRLASTQWDFDNNDGDSNNKNRKVVNKAATDESNPLGGFDLSDAADKFQKAFQNLDFDVSSLNFDGIDLQKIKDNIVGDGTFGDRGEAYFAAQAVLMACVLIGGIPLVGDVLMLLLGPGLLLSGLAVSALSFKDLGSSLSPWPKPANDAELKTDGLYRYVRHPMYAGVLAACAGFSIVTGSATRLLLTAVLLYVLDVKSDYEEDQLIQAYPAYPAYKSQVTNKFFPQEVLNQMPWVMNNRNKGE